MKLSTHGNRKLTEEQLDKALIRVAAGERIAAIAREFDVAPSSLSRRLKACRPKEMEHLNNSGTIRAGRRFTTRLRNRTNPTIEELQRLPEVQDVMKRGLTYVDAARNSLKTNPDDPLSPMTICRYVKRVCEHLDIPRPRQRQTRTN